MKHIETYLEEHYPDIDILLADGFGDAFVGVVESCGAAPKACYDYDACIGILMRDMDEGEALEYMEYNVTSAYSGEFTPAFIKPRERKDNETYAKTPKGLRPTNSNTPRG